jgi:hypothetical protein
MKVELHTLYWDNTPVEQIEAHKRVTKEFGLPVNYHQQNVPHGMWMDSVCEQADSDIIGFLDADCVPLSRDAVLNAMSYVKKNNTFLGIAQVSNHIKPKSHIYAAPAFFFLTKSCWREISTSFSETIRSDVGEEFTYVAESKGKRYRCLYPVTFEREPQEGVWPLGNYGYYGIGTVFDNYCYHLYQGRLQSNLELFIKRCNEIVEGNFDNRFHVSSTAFDFKGRVVP